MTNYGAYRMDGGLNLLAKRGNRPVAVGKMDVAGDQVYAMYQQGRCQEINDYCMFDTLDTYFIFLRTRVLLGEMSAEQEEQSGAASAGLAGGENRCPAGVAAVSRSRGTKGPPRKSLLTRGESRRRDRNHVRSLYCVRSPRGASNAIDLPPGAAAGGIVRLLTYNIHKGVGADRRYRLERVIAVIKAEAADLICLQEVDRNVRRSRRDNQPALLADKLDAAVHVYQLNVPRGEGGYGNLLLSRWPFREVRQIALNYKQRPPRGAQLVVVDTPAGPLHLVHIHLGLSSRERRWQAAHLLQHPLFQAAAHLPTLIAGDANDWRNSLSKRVFVPHGFRQATAPTRRYRTFPAFLPLASIDKIFYRGAFVGVETRVVRGRLARRASDHRPVVCDFRLATDDEEKTGG